MTIQPILGSQEEESAHHPGVLIIRILTMQRGDGGAPLCTDVAMKIVDYLMPSTYFGAPEYLHHWGVDVGPMSPFPLATSSFLWSRDIKDPQKNAYETHLPPVFLPEKVAKGKLAPSPYNLKTLENLARRPKEGPKSQYYNHSIIHDLSHEAHSGWIVMRPELLFRGRSYGEQKARMRELNASKGSKYELMPAALDMLTVAFALHVMNGDRHLGDGCGFENRWSFSRCQESVSFPCFPHPKPLVVGGHSSESGISVLPLSFDSNDHGVAAVRKFPSIKQA
jgi:hypothetical protein